MTSVCPSATVENSKFSYKKSKVSNKFFCVYNREQKFIQNLYYHPLFLAYVISSITAHHQSEPRRGAESRNPLELTPDEAALPHAVPRLLGARHSVVGRQQLARHARSPRGWLSGHPVARGRLVPGLRLRQVARDGRGCLRRVSHLADGLQSSTLARLSASAAASAAGWRSRHLERAARAGVAGTSTMAQGVRPR